MRGSNQKWRSHFSFCYLDWLLVLLLTCEGSAVRVRYRPPQKHHLNGGAFSCFWCLFPLFLLLNVPLFLLSILTVLGSVKSYAQNRFWSLVEIYYRGRLKRSLVTFQQAGRKASRARQAAWLLLHSQGFRLHGLQVLHVHVFLAAPLGSGHMAESGAHQHPC